MHEHPLAQDLIATVQKRPLLAELRDMRDAATSKDEADAIVDIIRLVLSGELDG